MLVLSGTSVADIVRYAAYLILAVVVPGTLVHRAVRGSRRNLPEDVGCGAATGLVLQLLVWALAAAVGAAALVRWWPLVVIAVFVAVPGLRRHWRIRSPRPLPVRWTWLMSAVLLSAVGWGYHEWRFTPLPPADTAYYQDLMYHLALVHEMTRSMPFQVPQLAGDTLHYHFLSDADMAMGSMVSGVAPAVVLLRLWAVPIIAIAALVLAALARDLTGRWWAGPLAAGLGFAGLPAVLGGVAEVPGGLAVSYVSPSQTYALPLLCLLIAIAVDAFRGGLRAGVWVMLPLLAVACAGAKSSALPPVVAGLVAGVVVAAVVHRRVPWAALGVLVHTVVAILIGLRLFAGGGAGVLGVQALSVLRWMTPYVDTLGVGQGRDKGGLVPLGVEVATTRGAWFVAWLVLWWVLLQAPRLAGLAALGVPGTRSDPVTWLLAGTTAAGAGGLWLFWHPSASQVYFYVGVIPIGALLTVRLLAAVHRSRWAVPGGLAAGAVWAVVVPPTRYPRHNTVVDWFGALAAPLLGAAAAGAVVLVAAMVVCHLMIRRRPWRAIAPAVLAATVGVSLGAAGVTTVRDTWDTAAGAPRDVPDSRQMITREEMVAAQWLDDTAGPDDVVATNVHCSGMRQSPLCDARAFWVAGLGGRRTLVESWGYADATVAAHGANDRSYPQQPAPYPSVALLNDCLFTTGDRAVLAELRQRFGVRWLFADSRADEVSPRLARIAVPRFVSGTAVVYEVPRGRSLAPAAGDGLPPADAGPPAAGAGVAAPTPACSG
ncbi:hypothetical protein GCM10012284_35330 [Mangrovihabitans endophyticus]|uniref:Uncharacterized protein n=1 Tax=Mangrovihabitans endophyticus TaxID=1751298 RepID=A0A8J3FQ49_9ACTN|nr:hypothetical protein GCM10012284_35330 [Mangrovihabitans endophyticus]